jgi:hypothetical protein
MSSIAPQSMGQTGGARVVAYEVEDLSLLDDNCRPTGGSLAKNLAPPLPAPVLAANRDCVRVQGTGGESLWIDKMEIKTDERPATVPQSTLVQGRPADSKIGGRKGVGP